MKYQILFLIFLCVSTVYPARFALLVGSTHGDIEDAELQYVEKDLAAFRSVLSELCGFDQSNILTLYNSDSLQLTNAFMFLNKKISGQKENLLLFYYTGHANEKGIKFGPEIIPFNRLKELLSSTGASIQIGIFDACQSGTVTTLKGGQLAAPFLFTTDTKIKGQVFLSSSSPKEFSLESDALQSSVFSFHLLNALRGSADITGDRKISLSEAYQYAYNHTVSTTARTTNGTQHPGYHFSIQGEGEIILADLSTRISGLMLSKSLGGIITVFDENNTLVADINKQANQQVLIALNKGDYTVTCHSAGHMLSCRKFLDTKGITDVSETDFRKVSDNVPMRQKGSDVSTRNRFDLSLGFHYLRPNFSNLTKQLTSVYSQYNYFGITPEFTFSTFLPMITVSQDFWIKNLVSISLSTGYSSMKNSTVFQGNKKNQFDGKTYGYSLICNNSLQCIPLSLSAGIKIRSGILKNLSFSAGVNMYGIEQKITNTFSDSLYNYTSETVIIKKATERLPFAEICYQYFFNEHFATGISAGYTYLQQTAPEDKNYETIPLFNPSEIDLSILFTLSLFKNKGM